MPKLKTIHTHKISAIRQRKYSRMVLKKMKKAPLKNNYDGKLFLDFMRNILQQIVLLSMLMVFLELRDSNNSFSLLILIAIISLAFAFSFYINAKIFYDSIFLEFDTWLKKKESIIRTKHKNSFKISFAMAIIIFKEKPIHMLKYVSFVLILMFTFIIMIGAARHSLKKVLPQATATTTEQHIQNDSP